MKHDIRPTAPTVAGVLQGRQESHVAVSVAARSSRGRGCSSAACFHCAGSGKRAVMQYCRIRLHAGAQWCMKLCCTRSRL
jgi:hypothetical protein